MKVERLILGMLETNCWLVSDDAGGPLIIIDPAGDADDLLAAVAAREVAAIVLTHGHFDHIGAVRAVMDATGAPLLVHEADAGSITSPVGNGGALFGFADTAPPPDGTLAEGDVVAAGDVRLAVLHTPGHTPGCISLAGGGHLFSGDTLFAGSVGRTDFPGGDGRTLRASVARLAGLPDETRVHPGHGPDTSIGRERRVNPFFPRA
ncbi:MAG: MBL fold metallo-hydrolase [Coriobacteriia bacterium]